MQFLKGILGIKKDDPNLGKLNKSFTEQSYTAAMSRISKNQISIVFNTCTVTFTDEEGVPFSYFLRCVNQQGKEYFFPISAGMNLSKKVVQESNKQGTIIQFDIDDKDNKIQLLFDTTLEGDEIEVLIFIDSICKLIYENVNKFSHKQAKSSQDYEGYIKQILSSSSLSTAQPKHQNQQQSDDINLNKLQAQFEHNLNLNAHEEPETKQPRQQEEHKKYEPPSSQDQCNKPKIDLTEQLQNTSVLLAASGSYYSVDQMEAMRPINKEVIFTIKDRGNFDYCLQICNVHQQLIYQKTIDSEFNHLIDPKDNFIKWSDFSQGSFNLFVVIFDSASTCLNLRFQIHQCMFQNNYKENLKDALKNDDLVYASKIMEEVPIMDDQIVKQYDDQPDIQIDPNNFISVLNQTKENEDEFSDQSRILEQAEVLDRTFLTKGPEIGVYRTDPQEKQSLQFICNLPKMKTLDGKQMNPKKILLNEKDTKVLVLNKETDQKVYQMDIESGKIVKEFLADEQGCNTITDMCPQFKHSQASGNPIFLTCNKKNIFLMDPRSAKSQVCSIQSKQKTYTTNNGFNCIQSTQNGQFATGSDTGDIRLYKEVGQNAKNKFPGLGDPILFLDSTKDGKWLLATCKTYLILLPTFSDNVQNGFTNTLKNSEKRVPYKLSIHPSDLYKYKIKQVNFTQAKFDESIKENENYIVTSNSNLLIIWPLKRVVQGYVFEYEIKQFQDNVLNAEFKYNSPDNIFAALPNELCMQSVKFVNKKKK